MTVPESPPPARRGNSTVWIIVAVVGAVGVVLLGMVAVVAAILFPVFASAREQARQTACVAQIKQVGIALELYAADHEGRLPEFADGEELLAVIGPYLVARDALAARELFSCPTSGQAHLFEVGLAGAEVAELAEPWAVPVLHEAEPHYRGTFNALFLDGTVRALHEDELAALPGDFR